MISRMTSGWLPSLNSKSKPDASELAGERQLPPRTESLCFPGARR